MGMFDSIEISYPLPLPLEVIDKLPDLYKEEFQTKDLECAMELYFLGEDGALNLLKQEREWVDDDSSFLKGYLKVIKEEIVPINYHGIINLYAYERIENENETGFDISVDYLAKFSNGKLESIELEDFEIRDASESIKETKIFFKKLDKERKKWYNKYFFYSKPYQFIKNLIVKGLYKVQNGISELRMFIIKYL